MAKLSATELSHNLLNQFLAFGIRDFVISPGSRNAPLTLALARAAKAGVVTVDVVLDERSAGYFALGKAQVKRQPVVLVCTSGTAAANYHPAALEAFHSQIPLIFLTADRPESLWGTGANQTTQQLGLLHPLISQNLSAENPALNLGKLPAHVNLQLSEPLVDDATGIDWWHQAQKSEAAPTQFENFQVKNRALVLIGFDQAGFSQEEITEMLADFGGPIVAESPFTHERALPAAPLYLSDAELRASLAPDQIIVIGRNTLSRSLNALVNESAEVIVLDPRSPLISPNRDATAILTEPTKFFSKSSDDLFLLEWQRASQAAQAILAKAIPSKLSEPSFAKAFAELVPANSNLFIGASRPARDFEAFANFAAGVSLFHNRGLAGIDGNISTCFGIAAVSERRSFAVIGDLTFLHDAGTLVNRTERDLTIFIIDNNGGGIFSTLPQAGAENFEMVFGTPQNQDLKAIISAYGHRAHTMDELNQLPGLLKLKGLNFVVVAMPTRTENSELVRALTQSVVNAVRIGNSLA